MIGSHFKHMPRAHELGWQQFREKFFYRVFQGFRVILDQTLEIIVRRFFVSLLNTFEVSSIFEAAVAVGKFSLA